MYHKTNSHTFTANAARATISGIAYNLIALMKLMALPKEQRNTTISTLRFQSFHVAGKLARHAGKIIIHLAQSNVFSQQIEALLANIHTLSPLVTN
ncbi:transposase [Levilactobacillus brevis]|uniref:transposase n=1 Tax=Levilactobacillus brevis TaxID=1580 RepID=UPI003D77DCE0